MTKFVLSRQARPLFAKTTPPMHVPPQIFWPYVAGGAAAFIGLARKWKELRRVRGLDAFIVLAPVFIAIGMAIFGADHLVAPKAVALVVPKWMPWREFWAIFVGVALEAAALGLSFGLKATLAAALLGAMIFCFALFVFLPFWLSGPTDRVRVVLLLRDCVLGWSYMAFAAGSLRGLPAGDARVPISLGARSAIVTVSRFVVAVGIGAYGILQLANPQAAPGFPPEGPTINTMPAWIPWHALWGYGSGAIFVACAIGLLNPKLARKAALVLGVTICVTILVVYVPLTVAKASEIDNGLNYLAIHFALAGAMLGLSAACRAMAAGGGLG